MKKEISIKIWNFLNNFRTFEFMVKKITSNNKTNEAWNKIVVENENNNKIKEFNFEYKTIKQQRDNFYHL